MTGGRFDGVHEFPESPEIKICPKCGERVEDLGAHFYEHIDREQAAVTNYRDEIKRLREQVEELTVHRDGMESTLAKYQDRFGPID